MSGLQLSSKPWNPHEAVSSKDLMQKRMSGAHTPAEREYQAADWIDP